MCNACVDAICPFCMDQKGLWMFCEGGTRLVFPDRAAMEDYMARYCNSYDWTQCSVAAGLARYYERTGAAAPRKGRPKGPGRG